VVHSAGLVVGATALAAVAFLFGRIVGHPPAWLIALTALGTALVTLQVVPIELEGSHWRVPAQWSLRGDLPFTAAFGVALGAGVTKLPSPAFYATLLWVAAAPGWFSAWLPLLAFAAGRAAPLAAYALRSAGSAWTGATMLATAPGQGRLFTALRVIEGVSLAVFAATLLAA
jgi:hypothetical protein